jgi:hypothetical protein
MTTPHLDDDALSAAVDGAATAAEEAHLGACGQCRQQMASLAAVARVVAAPVTPRPAHEVDDAVERALAAWSPAADDDAATAFDGGRGRRPTPGGAAPAVGSAVPAGSWESPPAGGRRGVPRGWMTAVAGVAAALVVVGGLAVALRGTRHPVSTTSAGPPSAAAAPSNGPSTTVAAANQEPPTSLSRDLGDQSDPATVARLVEGALSSRQAAAPINPASGQDSGAVSGALSCVSRAQTAAGLGAVADPTVAFTARLRWRGQPATAVVFDRPTGGLAGVVMTTADCSLLAVLPL